MSLLALIPARKGSKGLEGKALRTVGGVPLILRTLRTVEEADVAERIVVTTDWPELRDFCELRGYETLERPDVLAEDDVPLAPVIEHAVKALDWEGTVGVFQPTCPLLKAETVKECVGYFNGFDWAITTSPDPHIHWQNGIPNPRVQRQEIQIQVESGALQLMTSDYARGGKGDSVPMPISPREALDIDTPDDLLLAERLQALMRIHFVVAGGYGVGSGHIHRSRHLARVLGHHAVTIERVGHPAPAHGGIPYEADVTVFDCLQVPYERMLQAKQKGKVVVLEDEDADSGVLADLRVNDMLHRSDLRYAVLREEFMCLPEREHSERGERILATFGGTDPAGLSDRIATELGGYDLRVLRPGENVSMASAMREADLVVTGQGRTVLEAAACSTPCISLAANEREARHIRIPGVTYLGLHSTVTQDLLHHAVRETLESRSLREEIATTARANFDDRGADRLAAAIEALVL